MSGGDGQNQQDHRPGQGKQPLSAVVPNASEILESLLKLTEPYSTPHSLHYDLSSLGDSNVKLGLRTIGLRAMLSCGDPEGGCLQAPF